MSKRMDRAIKKALRKQAEEECNRLGLVVICKFEGCNNVRPFGKKWCEKHAGPKPSKYYNPF